MFDSQDGVTLNGNFDTDVLETTKLFFAYLKLSSKQFKDQNKKKLYA